VCASLTPGPLAALTRSRGDKRTARKKGMLAAKKLPEVLRTALHDGVDGLALMTAEGSLLCAVAVPDAAMNDTSLAAISSSLWNNYLQATPAVNMHLLRLEQGTVGVIKGGSGFVLAAYGEKVSTGLLKGRLEALSQYFLRVFEQLQ